MDGTECLSLRKVIFLWGRSFGSGEKLDPRVDDPFSYPPGEIQTPKESDLSWPHREGKSPDLLLSCKAEAKEEQS